MLKEWMERVSKSIQQHGIPLHYNFTTGTECIWIFQICCDTGWSNI